MRKLYVGLVVEGLITLLKTTLRLVLVGRLALLIPDILTTLEEKMVQVLELVLLTAFDREEMTAVQLPEEVLMDMLVGRVI